MPPDETSAAVARVLAMSEAEITARYIEILRPNWTMSEVTRAENEQTLAADNQAAYARWLRSAPDVREIAGAEQEIEP
jgi:hypothetical protein